MDIAGLCGTMGGVDKRRDKATAGQGMIPERADPITDIVPLGELQARLQQIKAMIRDGVERMPTHDQFIRANCQAPAWDS